VKFSARSQYALEAMLALAQSASDAPLQVRHISRDHGIPVRFLEQIMAALKKAGLVRSVRGARGGYLLEQTPDGIRVAEILQAVEGPIREEISDHAASSPGTQVVHELWGEAQESVRSLFDAITLEELHQRKDNLAEARSLMYHI